MTIKLSTLSAVLIATTLGFTPSFAFLNKVVKPSTKTKTSDDTAERKLPEYTGVKHALGVISFDNDGGYFQEMTLGDNLALMLDLVCMTRVVL